MKEVIAIDKDMTVKEAAKIMANRNIGSLVFIQGKKVTGIITETDIVKFMESPSKKISSIMARNVYTVKDDENLDEAARLMAKNKIKHLPVVNEDGNIAGIITAAQILENSEELEEDFLFE
jgi:CBS domain-containing protein